MRNMGPGKPLAVSRFLVDADDTVAAILEKPDNLRPAVRIVPLLRLGARLHRDADIGFGDRRPVIGKSELRRQFLGIDAEDIGRRAMQSNKPEIRRLIDKAGIIEE